MKKILMILLCAQSFSVFAQKASNYKELLKNAIPVTNPNWFDIPELRSNANGASVNVWHLGYLLDNNVADYYDLKQYDTELKKKAFANSAEGQSLVSEVKQLRAKVVGKQFYFLVDFGKSDEYDIESKTFRSSGMSDFVIDDTKIRNGYVYFTTMYLSLPTGVQYRTYYTGSRNFPTVCYQYLYVPVKNENVALTIEENISNCSVLFLFQLEGVKKVNNSNYIFGATQRLFIVNRVTGDIYFELPRPQPKK